MSTVLDAPPEKSFLAKYVTGQVIFAVGAATRGNGWVVGCGVEFDCFPDGGTRHADVAVHRLNRITHEQAMSKGHCTVVPDLVVEVVPPHDLADEVNRKRNEWLAAGAVLVWVVFPGDREAHAYTPDGTVRIFGPADTLTADPVLPDFRTPVADLFRLPTGT